MGDLVDDDKASVTRLFDMALAAAGPHVEPSVSILRGDVADGLLREAGEMDAGTIVVGRPGHGVLGASVFGSTVHNLLRDPRVPVANVPEHARGSATRLSRVTADPGDPACEPPPASSGRHRSTRRSA